jgi:hypothetical protein
VSNKSSTSKFSAITAPNRAGRTRPDIRSRDSNADVRSDLGGARYQYEERDRTKTPERVPLTGYTSQVNQYSPQSTKSGATKSHAPSASEAAIHNHGQPKVQEISAPRHHKMLQSHKNLKNPSSFHGTMGTTGTLGTTQGGDDENDKLNYLIDEYRKENDRCS